MSCLVIAHRGSSKQAPQNTMPAFEKAVEEGCDGFETDVHLTKDSKLVICHNYTVDDTSNGKGEISSLTSEEFKKLDFGSYFSHEFKGTPAPTLDEFLDYTAGTEGKIINIELKSPKNGRYKMVSKTLDAIKSHGVLDRVIISSFDSKMLKLVKEFDPRCKTAFLYPSTNIHVNRPEIIPFFTARYIAADIIHPAWFVVTKPVVKIAHLMGLKVNVWTVDNEKSVKRLLKCNVDGIITNCPGKVRFFINKYEKKGC